MKKIFKKALSIFLAALMCLTVAPVIVFAAAEEATTPASPVIALDFVEETETQIIVAVVLKENTFKCLDLSVSASESLTLKEIVINTQFYLDGGIASFNVDNGMFSIATLSAPVAEFEIAKYTYEKTSSVGVTASDFSVTIITCGLADGDGEIDVTDSTVIQNNIPTEHTHTADGNWETTTPATCAATGEKVRYCGICGEVAESAVVPKTDEHKNTKTETQAPSCSEEGFNKVFCEDCQTYISETTLETTDHLNTTTETQEPTCTEDGYTKVYCNDCKKYISEETIPSTGHGETTRERVNPTCTEDGYVRDTCTVCNEIAKETILSATGHGYITDILVATCTEDGYIRELCPACGDVKPGVVELLKTGHRWLDWVLVDEPTHSKEGVERRVCENCGIDEERSVPKLVTAPTELVLSMQEISMNFRQTTRLFVNVLPEEAAYSTEIIWESSNPEVATVDEDGSVYAVAPGTATITAKTADGTLTAECEVTVSYSIIQWIIIYILFGWVWYL